MTLSKAIIKANGFLLDLQETIIEHMGEEIHESLYQEESEEGGEEILENLSPINEWMKKLVLILPQIENNFKKTAQETEQLLQILSRKKDNEVSGLIGLFNEKTSIFRNLLESLKNIIEIYKNMLLIGAAHFSIREYSEPQTEFEKQANELLERLNELETKTTHFSRNGNGKKNSHNGTTENDNK